MQKERARVQWFELTKDTARSIESWNLLQTGYFGSALSGQPTTTHLMMRRAPRWML